MRRITGPQVIILTMLPLGLLNSASANIFDPSGIDPRLAIDRAAPTSRTFLPVGLAITNGEIVGLDGMSGRRQSNAFLVSPCYALVDYHGVFGRTRSEDVDYSMTLMLGAGDLPNRFRYAVTMKPVRLSKNAGHGRNGLVLMQLARCAGERVGWMPIEPLTPSQLIGVQVGMVGFSTDRPSSYTTVQGSCRIRGVSKMTQMLMHDCASRPGSTAAPLFTLKNGVAVAIASNWGGTVEKDGVLRMFTSEHTNLAVSLDVLQENPDITEVIESDIAAFGRPNPAAGLQR